MKKTKKINGNTDTGREIIRPVTIFENEETNCNLELYLGMQILDIAGKYYSVQVGVFRELAKAQVYTSLILSVYQGKGVYLVKKETYYCVRIGYFTCREKAYAVILNIKSLIERENRYHFRQALKYDTNN